MFKFIGKALAGLVLDKDAQASIKRPSGKQSSGKQPAAGKKKTQPGKPVAPSAKDAAIAQVQSQAKGLMTADRAALIQNAMKVRAAKQTILAELDDESRAQLVAMAMLALLKEAPKKE